MPGAGPASTRSRPPAWTWRQSASTARRSRSIERVAERRTATRPGRRLHLLCFSDHAPGDIGLRRITEGVIVTTFAADRDVEELRRDSIDITTGDQVPARYARLARR